jgi:hypothetical protein
MREGSKEPDHIIQKWLKCVCVQCLNSIYTFNHHKESLKMLMCVIPFSFSKVRRSFTTINSLILLVSTVRYAAKYIFVEAFRYRIPPTTPEEGRP